MSEAGLVNVPPFGHTTQALPRRFQVGEFVCYGDHVELEPLRAGVQRAAVCCGSCGVTDGPAWDADRWRFKAA